LERGVYDMGAEFGEDMAALGVRLLSRLPTVGSYYTTPIFGTDHTTPVLSDGTS
jgi:hypothetical protein